MRPPKGLRAARRRYRGRVPIRCDYVGGHPDAPRPLGGGRLVLPPTSLRFAVFRLVGVRPRWAHLATVDLADVRGVTVVVEDHPPPTRTAPLRWLLTLADLMQSFPSSPAGVIDPQAPRPELRLHVRVWLNRERNIVFRVAAGERAVSKRAGPARDWAKAVRHRASHAPPRRR